MREAPVPAPDMHSKLEDEAAVDFVLLSEKTKDKGPEGTGVPSDVRGHEGRGTAPLTCE